MRLSKLFSFIVVAMLVAVIFVGLVSVPAAAQTNEATSTVTATPKVVTATPTVAATTATVTATGTAITTIYIHSSTSQPNVGQTVTMYVYLYSGTEKLSKSVKIWHTEPDGTRVEDGTYIKSYF